MRTSASAGRRSLPAADPTVTVAVHRARTAAGSFIVCWNGDFYNSEPIRVRSCDCTAPQPGVARRPRRWRRASRLMTSRMTLHISGSGNKIVVNGCILCRETDGDTCKTVTAAGRLDCAANIKQYISLPDVDEGGRCYSTKMRTISGNW